MSKSGRGRKRALPVEPNNNKVDKNGLANETSTHQAKKTKKQLVCHQSHGKVPGCALTLGEGDVGQLGLGPDVLERVKPALVKIPKALVQICAGGMHTVCLTVDGEVFTFGCNDEGTLGRPTPEEGSEAEPGKVELDHFIVQVSAGDSHTAALTQEGAVYIWGTFRDANGSIGLTPDGKLRKTPIRIVPDKIITKISSGTDHLVCLTEGGDLFTLGNAEQGQLGRVAECFSCRGGRKGLDLLLNPGQVHCKRRKTKFTDAWTGQYVTYVQDTDGNVYAWGLNNYFQLGFRDMTNRFVPEKVKSFGVKKGWQAISGGQHHTVALDKEGKVYSLGRTEYGRLGLGENIEEKAEPTLVPALKDKTCVQIDCGTAVSFAVTSEGAIYAWGMGTSKQLAQREEDDLWEPEVMEGKQLETRTGIMVSAGGQHTVILAKDMK